MFETSPPRHDFPPGTYADYRSEATHDFPRNQPRLPARKATPSSRPNSPRLPGRNSPGLPPDRPWTSPPGTNPDFPRNRPRLPALGPTPTSRPELTPPETAQTSGPELIQDFPPKPTPTSQSGTHPRLPPEPTLDLLPGTNRDSPRLPARNPSGSATPVRTTRQDRATSHSAPTRIRTGEANHGKPGTADSSYCACASAPNTRTTSANVVSPLSAAARACSTNVAPRALRATARR